MLLSLGSKMLPVSPLKYLHVADYIVFEASWSEEIIKLQRANDLSTDIVGPTLKETSNAVKNPFTR